MPLEEDCAAAITAKVLNKRIRDVFLIDIEKRFLNINFVNIIILLPKRKGFDLISLITIPHNLCTGLR
jgi:hypothetical protein